ncbi:MAG: SAM-dependent methyltransferase [Betaproteobacteria bacterium]|nr:SAM-dependent methyltransferase [Betaproteobacteria bacterium]
MQNRKLFLIPVDLAPENSDDWVGARVRSAVLPLRRFVVEHPKSARQFLKTLGLPVQELEFEVLDEHSKTDDLDRLARWLESGGDVGLLSEAGCPAIADPGANLVSRAHRLGMQVVPLVGPSSIVLALMGSGLNGQRFAFNGYLPQASAERDARIRDLEERSRKLDQTEIFIEAPYRNDPLFKAIAANCRPETMLSLAIDLTSVTEEIKAKSIGEWRRTAPPQLHKRPTVFLLLAENPRSANRRRRTGNAH